METEGKGFTLRVGLCIMQTDGDRLSRQTVLTCYDCHLDSEPVYLDIAPHYHGLVETGCASGILFSNFLT
jgi:hypothetical protein